MSQWREILKFPAELLIGGAFVWDGRSETRSSQPWAIRVRGDRIVAMGPEPELTQSAPDLEVFRHESESEDWTALPGLIDSHVHLTLDPSIGSAAKQFEVPRDTVWKQMQQRAVAMLRAGITTARDLGAGSWQELELRDRIAEGVIEGPRLLCAGQPLTSPGGHCHFWGGEARGAEQVREVVQRQVDHHVDWIKVMATGGIFTKGTDVRVPQYATAELREIVACATSHGRSVAAHCHGSAGIRNAVAGGVRTVEHCSFAGADGFGSDFDEQIAAELAAAEAWVSPTVNAGWARRLEKDGQPTAFFERMSRCLGRLREAGARFIASTDAGIPGVEHHRLAEGLEAFARYSAASPVETLRGATSEAALALGLAGETGTLAPGLAADILVVAGNPLRDLAALQRPRLVFARGRPVALEPVSAG
jgi:imidazolonepropionase-like amidohydrolase